MQLHWLEYLQPPCWDAYIHSDGFSHLKHDQYSSTLCIVRKGLRGIRSNLFPFYPNEWLRVKYMKAMEVERRWAKSGKTFILRPLISYFSIIATHLIWYANHGFKLLVYQSL